MAGELSPLALRAAEEIAAWLVAKVETDCRLGNADGMHIAADLLRDAAEDAVLTIPDIADELNVRIATVTKLLDEGALPVVPGARSQRTRRVRLTDVRAYDAKMREERRQVLGEMAREAYESGLDDATDHFPSNTRDGEVDEPR